MTQPSLLARIAVNLALMLSAIGLVFYFSYFAVTGDRGIVAVDRLKAELALAEAELAVLRERRARLEHRVGLLRPDSLDPDLLGERARAVLGFAASGEVVVRLETPDALAELIQPGR